jgi:hypothetical protein
VAAAGSAPTVPSPRTPCTHCFRCSADFGLQNSNGDETLEALLTFEWVREHRLVA